MDQTSKVRQPPRLPHPVRITEQVWPEGTVPVVSVFCITYNHKKFINDAIIGFLMQETTFPVQIFIHDDASVDGTADIVRDYAERYPQLFWTVLQKENQWSKGNGKLLSEYLLKQKGQFLALCEGDDYWSDAFKLQKQVEFLEEHIQYVGCFTAFTCIDQAGCTLQIDKASRFKANTYNHLAVLSSVTPKTCSSVFRKPSPDVAEGILASRRVPNGDLLRWSFLTLKGPVAYLDYVTAAYRMHSGSVWGMVPAIEQARCQLETCVVLASWFASPDERLAIRARLFNFHRKFLSSSSQKSPRALFTAVLWFLKDVIRFGLPLTFHERKKLSKLNHLTTDPLWGRKPVAKARSAAVSILARAITTSQVLSKHRHTDLFDWEWYRQNNPEIAARTNRLFLHFCLFGIYQNRSPNRHYNPDDYRYSDPVATGRTTPLIHYAKMGYFVEPTSKLPSLAARASCRGRNPGVLYFPYAASNPYQRLLYRSLNTCYDIDCYGFNSKKFTPETIQAMRPRAKVLHLHWIEALCDPSSRSSRKTFFHTIRSAKQFGYRIIWTVHNEVGHEARHEAAERMLRQRLAEVCDNIFVHGRSTVPDYLEHQLSKISMTKHGHYANYYPDFLSAKSARKLLNIPQSARVALMFGKIRPYKRTKRVITELASALQMSANACLLVVGKDEMDLLTELPESLREQAALRFEGKHIPDHEVQFYFRAADVVLIPAENILTSGVAVLAASFNKPVLAMRRGLLPEILDGLAVHFSDSEDEFLESAKDFFAERFKISAAPYEQWQDWCSRNSWYHIVRAEPFVSLFGNGSRPASAGMR